MNTTGATASGGVQPNVLFVLDTSGSMSATDGTSPAVTRLDRMKDALHQILDTANNVNVVGLKNYITLFQDKVFWQAFGRTILFITLAVNLEFLFG